MSPTWTHEKLSLYHADCMDIMRQFPDKHFDLAIVDPPYGIGLAGYSTSPKKIFGKSVPCKGSFFVKKKWDSERPAPAFFEELRRISGHQIIWGGNYFADLLPASKGWIVWNKHTNGQFADGELAYSSFDMPLRIFDFVWNGLLQEDMKNKEQRIHPTQKPVALYRWLLAKYAQPGQRILDTHLGSGSHAIAAHYAGMEFTGIELDADYFKAACERIERETSQMTLSL